ncbi:early nodulin-75-like [Rosa chinensis]|uniref:early nodulin-75-like n=1 Tax=Rosa chinensis TaxID=74649 RepID=UPI001AD8CDA4|nr:early nodulin-75-like [Rosa chinensis]
MAFKAMLLLIVAAMLTSAVPPAKGKPRHRLPCITVNIHKPPVGGQPKTPPGSQRQQPHVPRKSPPVSQPQQPHVPRKSPPGPQWQQPPVVQAPPRPEVRPQPQQPAVEEEPQQPPEEELPQPEKPMVPENDPPSEPEPGEGDDEFPPDEDDEDEFPEPISTDPTLAQPDEGRSPRGFSNHIMRTAPVPPVTPANNSVDA